MRRNFILVVLLAMLTVLSMAAVAQAHRDGCHSWHSCPSDSGSYACGDRGYACRYPTYPEYQRGLVPDPTYEDYGGTQYVTPPRYVLPRTYSPPSSQFEAPTSASTQSESNKYSGWVFLGLGALAFVGYAIWKDAQGSASDRRWKPPSPPTR